MNNLNNNAFLKFKNTIQKLKNIPEKELYKLLPKMPEIAQQYINSQTGRLVKSLKSQAKDKQAITLTSNVEYAKYVEYGTSLTPARPFMKPTLSTTRNLLLANIRKALSKYR